MSGFCNVPVEDAALMKKTLRERDIASAAIPDVAMLIVENAMRRYVSQREQAVLSQHGDDMLTQAKTHTGAEATWYEALKAEEATTVRPFPYASLFLYPLPAGLCEFPYAPPSHLLPSSNEKLEPPSLRAAEGFRDMSMLNGGAPSMVTVLQGECGLAVTDGPSAFIMSPDATSCVVVACRVGLHPALRAKIASLSQSCSGGDAIVAPLLTRCSAVFAAAMAHVDRVAGAEAGLHDALWEAALPAWLRAAHTVTECPPHELITHLHAIQQEQQEKEEKEKEERIGLTGGTLLMVEWFVMGGIRVRENPEPILSTIFGAFFSPNASNTPRPVLSLSVSLSAVLPGSPDAPDVRLTVSHRLREDGMCFWSFNTVLRPWALGERGELYACAASWGLLLDLAGGACWPAALKPGTRTYPLAALRNAALIPWAWLFPLGREGALRVSRAAAATEKAAKRLGMRTFSEKTVVDFTLAEFVTQFLQRLRHLREDLKEKEKEKEEEEEKGKEVRQLPTLVRSSTWAQCPVERLDDIPDNFLLRYSTTPHCESPDFVELLRKRIMLVAELASEEIFPAHTAGILV